MPIASSGWTSRESGRACRLVGPTAVANAVSGGRGGSYGRRERSERRAWDSNPRDGCPPSGFQDRRTRPLCEPSKCRTAAEAWARPLMVVAVHRRALPGYGEQAVAQTLLGLGEPGRVEGRELPCTETLHSGRRAQSQPFERAARRHRPPPPPAAIARRHRPPTPMTLPNRSRETRGYQRLPRMLLRHTGPPTRLDPISVGWPRTLPEDPR